MPHETPNPARTADRTIVDPSMFAKHLTAADVDLVLHHGHWIAQSRGFTRQFLEQHHPGWSLGGLVAVFTAAGVRAGNRCRERVAAIHFDGPDRWLVEWTDGTTTCSQAVGR